MLCPVCRAENDLIPTCRRCKADLALLVQVETQRETALATARQLLNDGRPNPALQLAQQAHQARAGSDSARLLAVSHLLADNFALAIRWHQEATRAAAPF